MSGPMGAWRYRVAAGRSVAGAQPVEQSGREPNEPSRRCGCVLSVTNDLCSGPVSYGFKRFCPCICRTMVLIEVL